MKSLVVLLTGYVALLIVYNSSRRTAGRPPRSARHLVPGPWEQEVGGLLARGATADTSAGQSRRLRPTTVSHGC